VVQPRQVVLGQASLVAAALSRLLSRALNQLLLGQWQRFDQAADFVASFASKAL